MKAKFISSYSYSISTILAAGITIFLALCMIIFPAEVFDASLQGLQLWFQVVLPSILPFLIIAELMMGLGVVHFLGKLLEPLMRPLFNIPGHGAFVAAMGFTSGFPVGAILTGQLRRQGLCTRIEAERLISFTNNASPLFLLVAVPVGMLGQPSLGAALALIHYGTNFFIGLLMRFYGRHDLEYSSRINKSEFYSAWKNLIEARAKDGRPIGQMLRDAVNSSIQKLLIIGGFIVFFSVLLRILSELGLIKGITQLIISFIPALDPSILHSLCTGFWEITLGAKIATQSLLPLETKIILISTILGWSGLAIHAQVASMITGTDIRFAPFILCRIIHASLSGLILFGVFHFGLLTLSEPVSVNFPMIQQLSFSSQFSFSTLILLTSLFILLLLGIFATSITQIKHSLR